MWWWKWKAVHHADKHVRRLLLQKNAKALLSPSTKPLLRFRAAPKAFHQNLIRSIGYISFVLNLYRCILCFRMSYSLISNLIAKVVFYDIFCFKIILLMLWVETKIFFSEKKELLSIRPEKRTPPCHTYPKAVIQSTTNRLKQHGAQRGRAQTLLFRSG